MTSLLLRMAQLLKWAQCVIRYEFEPRDTTDAARRAWLRESDDLLDEIRQRMGI